MDPLIPRPIIVLISLALTGLMFVNANYDYRSDNYDGTTVTLACAGLIAAIIGREWFWRGKGGGDQ